MRNKDDYIPEEQGYYYNSYMPKNAAVTIIDGNEETDNNSYNWFNIVTYHFGANTKGKRVQVELNGFFMKVENLIQLAGNGLSIGYVNYANAEIFGSDFDFKSDLTPWLYSGFNFTYQRVVDNNQYIPGTQKVDNPTYSLDIPNIPQLFGNINLELHQESLLLKNSKTRLLYDLSYTHEYNYGFALSAYDDMFIPSFLTHTISFEQSLQNDQYTVTFEVNNLTDEPIINNYNQPLPGRTFRIKLRCLLLGKPTQNHNH